MTRILIEIDHETNQFKVAHRDGATPLVSDLQLASRNEIFERIKLTQGGALATVEPVEDNE